MDMVLNDQPFSHVTAVRLLDQNITLILIQSFLYQNTVANLNIDMIEATDPNRNYGKRNHIYL